MRTYVPDFPVPAEGYSRDNEAAFRAELARILQDMQQARPEDFVTISTSVPSGTPPQGVGSLWIRIS